SGSRQRECESWSIAYQALERRCRGSTAPSRSRLRYILPLMKRRTVLGAIASLPAWAQPASFPGEYAATLREVAAIVLPGEADADRTGRDFSAWVNGYRGGAETDHVYGNTRIRVRGASPASGYLTQLAALKGKVSRESITAALQQSNVTDLPRTPG